MKYLLDTNVISEIMRSDGQFSVVSWVDENDKECAISCITLGEVERGMALLAAGRRKNLLQEGFRELQGELEGRILPFDAQVARVWAHLAAAAQKRGRQTPLLDSMIEATAIFWDLTVVTRNTTDFVQAPVVNPWAAR